MDLETLVDQYIKAATESKVSRLKFGQRAGLRAFADWADRRGFELYQSKGDNGPVAFCKRCGASMDPAGLPLKKKGGG